ncbi:hypothetical protein SAMN04488577_2802 [Bacillus sp. cl95]|nr:hypothetical protein SAMN02799634_105318 [Bacillus sp. UNCCL13]SFQ86452.1 hypothetical protein SAMN04488577_2802 [Bacillus sp. cl95]
MKPITHMVLGLVMINFPIKNRSAKGVPVYVNASFLIF